LGELLLKARAPLEAVGLALHGRREGAVLDTAAPADQASRTAAAAESIDYASRTTAAHP
jgi:hypothetical protein